MTGGAAAMPDYELLELVLFRALPRQDVKPLARRLIDRFGGFSGALSASREMLLAQHGVGDAVVQELKIVEAAAHRLAQRKIIRRSVVSSWDALLDYCQASMGHRQTEELRILFLDTKNQIIADESLGQGTVDHVPIYPREVVKRALDLAASALILVHNHPSGDPTPSEQDIDMTRRIEKAARALDITVHDHVIIGRSGNVSFRADGYL